MRRWRLCWAVWIKLPPDRRVKFPPCCGVEQIFSALKPRVDEAGTLPGSVWRLCWLAGPRCYAEEFPWVVVNYGKLRCVTIYLRKLMLVYCGMAHSCFLNISPFNFLKMFVSNWSSSTDSSSYLWFIRWSQPHLTMKSQPEERPRLNMTILAMLTMTINHQYSLTFLNNIYSFLWVEWVLSKK